MSYIKKRYQYEVTERQILKFLQTAWRRQEKGLAPLSQNYWCRSHSPHLKAVIYIGILDILTQAKIVINRRQGASGELSMNLIDAIQVLIQES